jgi:fructose-specific phosphotransferase system IIC component
VAEKRRDVDGRIGDSVIFPDVIASVLQVFLLAVLLATINERLVELFIKRIHPVLDAQACYVALVTGLVLAFLFNVDFVGPVAEGITGVDSIPYAGLVLSGIMIGAGSNFLHDVWPGE